MKKTMLFCITGALALSVCPVSAADGTKEIPAAFRNIKVVVDGKGLAASAEPFIYNGTAYLPVRAVGEAVGMEVSWDESGNTVTLTTPPPAIRTDFELAATPSGTHERTEIFQATENLYGTPNTYSLYYYGLSDVSVTLDGQTLPLAQALQDGMLTPHDILEKAREDKEGGKIRGDAYRDGGSLYYVYEDFSMLKFNSTIRDFYIGVPEMEINKLGILFYPEPALSSMETAIEHLAENVALEHERRKKKEFEYGLSIIKTIAIRDNLSEDGLKKAIREYEEKSGMDTQ